MSRPDQSAVINRLLSLMAPEDFDLLAPRLEKIALPKGLVIVEPQQPITQAVFFERGVGSIVAVSPDGLEVEGGLLGRDGVTPIDLVLGSDQSPNRAIVQIEGEGWRIAPAALRAAMEASSTLRGLLLRYAQTFTQQATYTALSNAVHPVDERLARWLLMCDDRSDGGDIPLTHESISIMLAVRRPSVTTSLHTLEANGFIRLGRGSIVIRNRSGLESFAGDSYGKPEAEYERLIGSLRPPLAAF